MILNAPTIYKMLLLTGVTLLPFLPAVNITAQTVAWQLSPSNYSNLKRFGPGLYQVELSDKIGLIRPDGTVVAPIEADHIGGFYEHLALVTRMENGNYQRVLGALSDDGTYTAFGTPFFTLEGQEFFSDGLLSVQDAKGKKGYVDRFGNVVCGFKKNYYRIKPFTGGFATVTEGRDKPYYLIDKEGQKQIIQLPDVGVVKYVFNPVEGKVLVVNDYYDTYKYTIMSGTCERLGIKMTQETSATDYLYRPKMVLEKTGAPILKAAPFATFSVGEKGLKPTVHNGKYGFETVDGKTILPCQLDAATEFEDNLSVVTLHGKLGLLRYHEEDKRPFDIIVKEPLIEFDAGASVSCLFSIQTPETWAGKNMEVTITDKTTLETITPTANGDDFSFTLMPKRTEQKEYAVSVVSEGLQLWNGNMAFALKKKIVDLVINSLTLDKDITDPDYRVTGSFIISNPNDDEMTTNISFAHSDLVMEVCGYPKTVTLAGGETKRVTFFIVTSNKRGSWSHTLTVSSSKGGTATLTKEIEAF